MKQQKIYYFLLVFLFAGLNVIYAQPFAEEIASFRKQDSIAFPPKQAILFVGSSSFTKWTDVQKYFPGHTIINRGFGGSTLSDLIRYEQAVIFKYDPRQIIIYCGENDVASADSVTGEMVCDRFKKLFTDIRLKFPKTPVVFVSIKPTPLRWKMKDRMVDANNRIKRYLKRKKRTVFIDVWNPMLGKNGVPLDNIFTEDKLHMNAEGYTIWQKLIEPYLKK